MDSIIAASDPRFPPSLGLRLGSHAPRRLALLGDPALLSVPTLGLCFGGGVPAPLQALLTAMATAACAANIPIISGFQTPLEREWMLVALRDTMTKAIVIPAQPVDITRLPPQWRQRIEARRLLVVQPFGGNVPRHDQVLAQYSAVAALCRAQLIAHAVHGTDYERLAQVIRPWPLPLLTTQAPMDAALVALGAQAIAPEDLVAWWSVRFAV